MRTTRRALLVVFALACALHLYAWYVNPERPSLTDDVVTGWYGGASDQINYAREARALARGELPGVYWDYARWRAKPDAPANYVIPQYAYGLGYPILGAPFVKLGLRRDPFVVPDTLAFGLIICLALLLARRFVNDTAAIVFAGLLAVASPLLPFTVMPWNSTVTAVAVLAALLFATSDRRDWKVAVALGVALSLCYAARYADVVWAGAIVAAGVVLRGRDNLRRSAALCAIVLAMLAATYAAVGVTHKIAFGDFFTNPYHYHIHNGIRGDSFAGFRLGQVPRAFSEVFVTASSGPRRVAAPHTSVLRAFPWLVAAPFGLVLLIRRRHGHLPVVVAASAVSVLASVFYLAYWSGTGADLENNNVRFFVPWFALWGLLAAVALAELVERLVAALPGRDPSPHAARPRVPAAWIAAVACVPVALALLAYATTQTPVDVDLVGKFGEAERRPTSAGSETFDLRDVTIRGSRQRAIYAHPPSRLTWKMICPDHATLELALGVDEDAWGKEGDGVLFVVGVADAEGYHEVLRRQLDPRNVSDDRRWIPVKIDLEPFAGRPISLILSTNTSLPGRPSDPRNDLAYWGAPKVAGYKP